MRPVLIDASSAILVYKVGLFDVLQAAYPLAMVPAVIREVTVNGRDGAAAFQRAFDRQTIKQQDPVGQADADPELITLGAGERETLMAYQMGARFIIIDDRKAALICKRRQISYINAILCTKILHASGYINHAAYQDAFEQLQSIGRYAQAVLRFARECPTDELAQFWPAETL